MPPGSKAAATCNGLGGFAGRGVGDRGEREEEGRARHHRGQPDAEPLQRRRRLVVPPAPALLLRVPLLLLLVVLAVQPGLGLKNAAMG